MRLSQGLPGQVFRQPLLLDSGHVRRLGLHDPTLHRTQDRTRRHDLQQAELGRLGDAALVTAGAILLIESGAIALSCRVRCSAGKGTARRHQYGQNPSEMIHHAFSTR